MSQWVSGTLASSRTHTLRPSGVTAHPRSISAARAPPFTVGRLSLRITASHGSSTTWRRPQRSAAGGPHPGSKLTCACAAVTQCAERGPPRRICAFSALHGSLTSQPPRPGPGPVASRSSGGGRSQNPFRLLRNRCSEVSVLPCRHLAEPEWWRTDPLLDSRRLPWKNRGPVSVGSIAGTQSVAPCLP